jgi:hypothetical protein
MLARLLDASSRWGIVLALSLCLGSVGSAAKGGSHGSSGKTVHVKAHTRKDGTAVAAHDRKAPPAPSTAPTIKRDERGRIQRSEAARHAFARQTGYPNGRPGYVIDHIKPLACGGADAPSNMQWQTVAEAKAKDKTERIGCR